MSESSQKAITALCFYTPALEYTVTRPGKVNFRVSFVFQIVDHVGIREAFVNYFKNFYKSKRIQQKEIQKYLDRFAVKPVSDQIKDGLSKEVLEEEILEAVKQMKPNKSPGPDGFMAIFYKKFKEDLIPVLKELISMVVKQKRIPYMVRSLFNSYL